MNLGFMSFASSSSGNCYLVKSENTYVLVDVGISASRIVKGLEEVGLKAENVKGVLLTHEHIDHVKSVSAFHKKSPRATFLASEGTLNALDEKAASQIKDCKLAVSADEVIEIGDLNVKAFNISHDAAQPLAYVFERNGKKLAILTDTGCVTEEIFRAVAGADILVLEANHEENILLYGRYPYSVKRRILSDQGHLSNVTCGKFLCRLLDDIEGEKVPKVFLAHLSKENNTPEQAYLTVRNTLEEEDFYIGKDLELEVITSEGMESLEII